MKAVNEIVPNYGPVYAAALYPEMCSLFQRHGYALAVHGSLARDLDLVAVPWSKEVSAPEAVLKDLTEIFAVRVAGTAEAKGHGRVAYTLTVGFGECACDLSFFPCLCSGSETE